MRYLYYCNSAYQLINILNLHWHRQKASFEQIDDYQADLLLLDAFFGADRLCQIVREKGVFENVTLIRKAEDNSGVFHLFKSFSDIAFPGNYLKKKFGLDAKKLKYDVLTVPKFSRVVAAIWQLNKNAELQLYEDGLASYCYDLDLIVPRSKSYKLLYRRLNHGREFVDFSFLYLVAPDLFIGDCDRNRIRLIPAFNESYLEEIKSDFKEFAGNEDELDKNLLWFSQSMFDDSQILKILEDYKDEVLFCPHPRYPVETDLFQVARKNQIWEIKALNLKNINNVCIVSINSTSLFNPKLLFNEEPYIIFVYKLVKLFYSWSFFNETVERFKELYSVPDKVMIPETMDEFRECVEKVLHRIHNEV